MDNSRDVLQPYSICVFHRIRQSPRSSRIGAYLPFQHLLSQLAMTACMARERLLQRPVACDGARNYQVGRRHSNKRRGGDDTSQRAPRWGKGKGMRARRRRRESLSPPNEVRVQRVRRGERPLYPGWCASDTSRSICRFAGLILVSVVLKGRHLNELDGLHGSSQSFA